MYHPKPIAISIDFIVFHSYVLPMTLISPTALLQVLQVALHPAVAHDHVAFHHLAAARVHLRDAHRQRARAQVPADRVEARVRQVEVRRPVLVNL